MMRIITGSAKGKKLLSLEGDATRPTSESPYIAQLRISVPAVAPGGREDDMDRIATLFGQLDEAFHPFDGFRVQRVLGDAFDGIVKGHGIDDAVYIHENEVMHGRLLPCP